MLSLFVILVSGVAWADPVPVYDSETESSETRLAPEEAAKGFRVPEGFQVGVFAAEPDVRNPIACAHDGRGRLWVAENFTYAENQFDLRLQDQILIFEDKDGDGHFDGRKIFTDDIQMLTSVEVGTDGVWAMCPPRLIFIPDRDHNDRPDGPAEAVLDGFHVPRESYHNFANGLRWGPDGWLYGRCGGTAIGRVGAPGTPDEIRTPIHGGIWRYHPGSKAFEVLCHGTTNPWGHDWNEVGELFFINTVNGHLWHCIPGAHLQRPHTLDPNPRAYELIEMHADHWHWDTTKDWMDSRKVTGEHDRKGGGHAHSGVSIYLGDNWPDSYRGRLLTINLHGRRMNVERLEREGSGYVGRHEPDTLFAADPWFRGLDLTYGPDGGLLVLDWCDAGECHERTGVHRTSGRIYKVTAGIPPKTPPPDVTVASARQLLDWHQRKNEWYPRMARRELVRRAERKEDLAEIRRGLRELFAKDDSTVNKLRALWSSWVIGDVNERQLMNLLSHPAAPVRVWAVRLLGDAWPIDTINGPSHESLARAPIDGKLLETFMASASSENSPEVRLAWASMLQRLPVANRASLAGVLSTRGEDADDHNLPLMLWYGLIPVADFQPAALAEIGARTRIPLLRKLIARRFAEDLEKSPAALNQLVDKSAGGDIVAQTAVIDGMLEGLAGWASATPPASWPRFRESTVSSPELSDRIRELDALFGDGRALDQVRALVFDDKADLNRRLVALQTLIRKRPDDLRQMCEKLLDVRFLNTVAAKGLAEFDDAAIGDLLAKRYFKFHQSERPAVIEALVSRRTFARSLLDQMSSGKIPRSDLSAGQARQIRNMGDAELTQRVNDVWGEVRDSSVESQALMAQWKSKLTVECLKQADRGAGRVVFNKICATCHRLHGPGGAIGPDLTGAGRHNIDYLLQNIIAPSDVVPVDYRVTLVTTTDGRVLSGVIVAKTEQTITLQTATEKMTISRDRIDETSPSTLSLMPEGLFKSLTDDQVRDLIAYLMHPTQVALPAGAGSDIGSSIPATPARPGTK